MNNVVQVDPQSRRTDSEAQFTVRIAERREAAEGVIALTLESVKEGTNLPKWSPGAHIDVILRNDVVRQYSLCGDSTDRARYRIGVLRDPHGHGSALVHQEGLVGTPLTLRGPRNHFELAAANNYLFIAGGIGITPILPMIAEAKRRGAEWKLLYSGRSRRSMAFLDELQGDGERVEICPRDEFGRLDLGSALAEAGQDVETYACGPEPLLQAIKETCERLGRNAPRVERFRPAPSGSSNTPFKVELLRSGRTIAVSSNDSVLEAIEAAGISATFSCREGTCGSCETSVLAGEVDHRDSILTDIEKEDNDTMMICVSRCRGSRLVLDL